MDKDISKIIASEIEITEKVNELAEKINSDYRGKKLTVVGILKGSVIFFADLVRKIDIECQMDFMAASSYGSSAVSSGEIIIKKDLSSDVTGKDVLIVEDILDTGNTLYLLKDYILKKGAASVKICTLFEKPSRHIKPVKAEYTGFIVDDLFIVGYGLDYDEKYRNLPYVGVLKPEIYS